jgi:hypothetical protein
MRRRLFTRYRAANRRESELAHVRRPPMLSSASPLVRVCATALAMLAASCTAIEPQARWFVDGFHAGDPPALAGRCERTYATIDDAVAGAGVGDAMATRISGFPYLRANRLLASFRDTALDDATFEHWVSLLAALDRDARAIEIANLPAVASGEIRARMRDEGFGALTLVALLEGCANTLRDRDLGDAEGRSRLRAAASVPDDYVDWMRLAGLYPVAALPFAIGVRHYEAATHAAFSLPLADLPLRGALRTYRPPDRAALSPEQVRAILERAGRNPLRMPLPDANALDALLAAFAPVLVVDEQDSNDRIGQPRLRADSLPEIDTAFPVVFARAAHTRVGNAVLLQLVYTAWFPARPPTGPGDLLAGQLDSLIWRVTLAPDGTPLLFDSIHGCGCYHLFVPTARVAPRERSPGLDEGALVPQTFDTLPPGARIGLRVEAGTHYLRRMIIDTESSPGSVRYVLASDDALRTLRRSDGTPRSLYGPDGLVPGTERGERFFFWPMGIAGAGAMRQWGRHATAFIGRRHFDEPFLIERYFTVSPDALTQQRGH